MSATCDGWQTVRTLVPDDGPLRPVERRSVRWSLGSTDCLFDPDANRAWLGSIRGAIPTLEAGTTDYLQSPRGERSLKVFLHVAHDCNLRCRYCYAGKGLYGGARERMSWTIARQALRWAGNIGGTNAPRVVFFGGEPWLNTDLIERVVREFPDYDYSIVTNGTLFDSRRARVAEEGEIAALVSIDGAEETHDRYRRSSDGEGSYDRVVKNLSAMRSSHRSVAARAVYEPGTSDLVADLKHLLGLGFRQISFRPRWHGMGRGRTAGPDGQLRDAARWYFDLLTRTSRAEIGPLDGILRRLLTGERKLDFCGFGASLSVAPSGRVFPCTHFVSRHACSLGEVTRPVALDAAVERLREVVDARPDPCDECWVLPFCGRGCKAECFGLNGGFRGGDGFCDERKLLVWTFLESIVSAERRGLRIPRCGDASRVSGGDRWSGGGA